jgi:Coenzyme PQQ synthesis protein D (PqqD)
MASETHSGTEALLASRVRLPQHVVYRTFPSETVVLNLHTGRYHGLNPTAGRMLASLEDARCVRDAASAIAGEYDQPQDAVEHDICELCSLLLSRELVELVGPTSS